MDISIKLTTISAVSLLLSFLMQFYAFSFKASKGFSTLSFFFLFLSLAMLTRALYIPYPFFRLFIPFFDGLSVFFLYVGIHLFRNLKIKFSSITIISLLIVSSPLFYVIMDIPHILGTIFINILLMVGLLLSIVAILKHNNTKLYKFQVLCSISLIMEELTILTRIIVSTLTYNNTEITFFEFIWEHTQTIQLVDIILLSTSFIFGCIEINEEERDLQEKSLAESQNFLQTIVDTISIPIFYKNLRGEYVMINDTLCKTFNTNRDNVLGNRANSFFDSKTAAALEEVDKIVLKTMKPYSYETKLPFSDGLFHSVIENKTIYKNTNGEPVGIVGTITDITDQKIHEAKIRHMALYDMLTTLPNRNLFFELADKSFDSAKRFERYFSLMYLDLDGFKSINDTIGHDAGDYVLKQVANRLKKCTRNSDVIGRLGGDEFAIVFNGTTDTNHLTDIANSIINIISQPMLYETNELSIGISIGIAICKEQDENLDSLIKRADSAMYESKRNGKNRFTLYE